MQANSTRKIPLFVSNRLAKWRELTNKPALDLQPKKISINIEGKQFAGVAGISRPCDYVSSASKGDSPIIVAKVNDELYDLTRPLEEDCEMKYFDIETPEGKKVFWHSSAHILAQTLEFYFEDTRLCTGPPLDEGFYYDISIPRPVVQQDYESLNGMINKGLANDFPFERLVLSKEDALEMFRDNKYKLELINAKVPDGGSCTAYKCGTLIDLCKGPHVVSTGVVKALRVIKNSSSYWKGDANNDSLQRIYGISFHDAKLMEEWETMKKEAEKRDHRNIGKAQELMMIHPYSPGSVFFLPSGAKIYHKLVEFIRKQYRVRGFTEVITPNIFNKDLWITSGHWDNYKDNMFALKVDDQEFALKPMNCPGHCLIFNCRQRSYRELPIRLADFGVLHRNEFAGALTGLTRVRRFQQDDAHIFCTQDQIESEIKGSLDFIKFVYGVFGFDFSLELSTRPEKYLGDLASWDNAENQLKAVLNCSGKEWKINLGDGAFYGPKIDIHVTDALKRRHQCATIQLDFNLPERFQLSYHNLDDSEKRPVIIHRAIFGSVERFLAILMEHTAGKWPFWLSPKQVVICSVSSNSNEYAKEVHQQLWREGFEVDLDVSDKKLPKKIHNAQVELYNFILVVGENEKKENKVNVRTREGVVLGTKTIDELIHEFKQLASDYC